MSKKQDTKSPDVDYALGVAADRLNVRHHREGVKYGWNHKSAGSKVLDKTGNARWLRVQHREKNTTPNKLWSGIKDADRVSGVKKPDFITSTKWVDNKSDLVWRGDLISFISETVCSNTPTLRHKPSLDDGWFDELRNSLTALDNHKTDRPGSSQDFITRRINEYVSEKVDTKVDVWTTVHGDIHWANITTPELWILDWEGWGLGPFGLDAAVLWAYSLMYPSVAERVYKNLRNWLDTPDGRRSQLFVCGMILRMADDFGDHPDLAERVSERVPTLVRQAPVR